MKNAFTHHANKIVSAEVFQIFFLTFDTSFSRAFLNYLNLAILLVFFFNIAIIILMYFHLIKGHIMLSHPETIIEFFASDSFYL